MKHKFAAVIGAVAIALSLSACDTGTGEQETIGGNITAPLMTSYINLDGGTLEVKVGQAINIDTNDHPVDSVQGAADDERIAEFVPGRVEATAEFNPGFATKTLGETTATLTSDWGDPVTFTIKVVE